MKKKIILSYFFIIFIILKGVAQTTNFNNFKSNESICYCAASNSTPNAIAQLDNNWELLLLLQQPKSTSQLDSLGTKYTLSQLQLLEQWNLIKKNEKSSYQTSIIILDKAKTESLRNYSRQISNNLADQIKPDINKLKTILRNEKREKNIYTILFSYVMDGMVWGYLEKENLIKKNEISLNRPIWDGEFWTLFPKRDFYCGTNSISDKGISLKVNWSESTIAKMLPFVSRFDLQEKILSDLAKNGKISDKEVMAVFGKFNFFDKSGNLSIPIIIENDTNDIYNTSKSISTTITNFLKSKIDLSRVKKEYGFSGASQAIIILYHEMLWDILATLEKEGIIAKPIAFKAPNETKPENISDLILIVKE